MFNYLLYNEKKNKIHSSQSLTILLSGVTSAWARS